MSPIILTERNNPETSDIDLLNGEQIATLINQEDKSVALAVQTQLPVIGQAIEKIADSFLNGGRLGYFGAGTSGRLGILDASECPPTFGVSPSLVQGFIAGGEKAVRCAVENAEDDSHLAEEDVNTFAPIPQDIIVGISASGNSNYIIRVLQYAKEKNCTTIGISSNPQAKMQQYSDLFICPQVGPEVITGSSRMKSGTAQKMILNMLSTGAMIRCGKTYHNYMIDLRITNDKLYQRACRIIQEIAQVTPKEAEKHLELAHQNVKLACLMAQTGLDLREATQLLEKHRGILRSINKE